VAVWFLEKPITYCPTTEDAEAVEAVKFLWKRKHFKERSWKQKRTLKHLNFWGAGSKLGSD